MREIEQLEVDLGAGGFLRITQTDWVRRRHILPVTVDTTGQATIQLMDGSGVAVDPRYLDEFSYGRDAMSLMAPADSPEDLRGRRRRPKLLNDTAAVWAARPGPAAVS